MARAPVTLTVALGSDEERNVKRYEDLRARAFALPLVRVSATATHLQVTFDPLPPPLTDAPPELAARAVGWVARLEGAWGSSLGAALHEGELCFDEERRLFAVGPGLVRPSGRPSELARFARALGVDAAALTSWGQLRALATAARPGLAPLLKEQATPEETVDDLLHLAAQATTPDERLRYAEWAFRVRETDPATAERYAQAWLEAKRPGEPPGVRAVLAAVTDRPAAAVLLARLDRLRSDLPSARGWAERAVAVGGGAAAWKELARVAHAQGDRQRALDAMVALAREGDERALEQVALHRPEELGGLLDGWRGPWSRAVIGLRLAQLHRAERLKDLLREFLAHLDLAEPSAYDAVLEAAERCGTEEALRQQLWRAVEARRGPPELVTFVARLCRRKRIFAPLLALAERHPALVPAEWRAEALLAERRYDELVALPATSAEVATARLLAMAQLELDAPRRFGDDAWLAAGRIVLERGGRLDPALRWLETSPAFARPLALLRRLSETRP